MIYEEQIVLYEQKKIQLQNKWHFMANKTRDYATFLKMQ